MVATYLHSSIHTFLNSVLLKTLRPLLVNATTHNVEAAAHVSRLAAAFMQPFLMSVFTEDSPILQSVHALSSELKSHIWYQNLYKSRPTPQT